MVAPLAGIAVVAGALLGQSVGLADGGIEVDGERRVAGSGPTGPGPGQQLPAHPVQLADVAQVKVMVNEFPQAQMPGEGGRQEQTGIGHQAVIVKDDTDTVGVVAW